MLNQLPDCIDLRCDREHVDSQGQWGCSSIDKTIYLPSKAGGWGGQQW